MKRGSFCAFLFGVLWGLADSVGLGQATPRTSTFDSQWLDTVVSIERNATPLGTGFLVKTAGGHDVLVTAKHVVCDDKGVIDTRGLAYRVNMPGGAELVEDSALARDGGGTWFFARGEDLAIRFFGAPGEARYLTIGADRLLPPGALQAGAPVVVLGFPLGLRDAQHALPIARAGIVARVEPNLFLVDAFVFGGNSGGPVVYSPVLPIGPPDLVGSSRLAGVVIAYVKAVAVPTPGRTPTPAPGPTPSPTPGVNTGLSIAIPVDVLVDLLSREDVKQMDARLPR